MATRVSIQLTPQASAALAELIQPHACASLSDNTGRMASRMSIQLSPQALAGIIQPHPLPLAIPENEVDVSRLPTRMSIQLPPQASAALATMMQPHVMPEYPPDYAPHRRGTRMSIQLSPQALAELLQSTSSELPPAYASLYPALYATKASSEPYIVSLEYPDESDPLPCTSIPRFSTDMGAYPGPPFYVVTFDDDYEMEPTPSQHSSPFTEPTPKRKLCNTCITTRIGIIILVPVTLLLIALFTVITIVVLNNESHHKISVLTTPTY